MEYLEKTFSRTNFVLVGGGGGWRKIQVWVQLQMFSLVSRTACVMA